MKFEWKLPPELYPRLAQALVVVLIAGFLYIGAKSASHTAAVALTPVQETDAYQTDSPSPKAETDSLQETSPASKTQQADSAKTSYKKERVEIAVDEPSSEKKEIEIAVDEPSSEEAQAKTETAPVKYISIVEYPDGSPYAASESTFSILQKEIYEHTQLQPNYLDPTKSTLSWKRLAQELSSMTDSFSGQWSVYVKELSTGESLSLNPQPMESASLIKLFIMGAVLEQIEDETLERTSSIDRLLSEMITVSDNEAANELVRRLSKDHDHKDGLTYVNSFASRHGFDDTKQVNGLEDSRLHHQPSEKNMTSAMDCGELLSQIYEGTLVSHLASREMEDLLLQQEVLYKIPAALPGDIVTANKTGELSDAENDAAIVYSPDGDFILCIMSGEWDSKNQAITHIREVTKLVYSYFAADRR